MKTRARIGRGEAVWITAAGSSCGVRENPAVILPNLEHEPAMRAGDPNDRAGQEG